MFGKNEIQSQKPPKYCPFFLETVFMFVFPSRMTLLFTVRVFLIQNQKTPNLIMNTVKLQLIVAMTFPQLNFENAKIVKRVYSTQRFFCKCMSSFSKNAYCSPVKYKRKCQL